MHKKYIIISAITVLKYTQTKTSKKFPWLQKHPHTEFDMS